MRRGTVFWKKGVQICLAEQKEHSLLFVVLDPMSLSVKLAYFSEEPSYIRCQIMTNT